ncbi:MAG TPA: rod shape-determining protein MreC [Acidobacteriaceae bacterium]|nr:rod shape-determining protein MreC [Acidobacteriaceae bacterium]
MESFLSRYRNLIVLLAVVLGQMIGLAVQVRKSAPVTGPIGPTGQPDGRGVRLIRVWAETAVMPFERGFLWTGSSLGGLWANYVDLRNVRQQNKDLQQTVDRLRFEQAQVYEDALEGQRLKELLKFQQSYVYATTPAQVIGASGSLQSRVMWIDKGIADGVKVDMAVVTPDGIVGKVREAFTHTSQVLAINDQSSGAGVILETTRIRGILRGNAQGQPQVINILMDSRIKAGERVLTAGGDQIFPRGLPVGVVEKVEQDPERSGFINVIVKPATNLQHVDEVLVITSLEPHLSAAQMADLKTSEDLKGAEVAAELARKKAAAEMAERLPSLKDPNDPNAQPKLGPDGKPIEGTAASPTAPPAKPLPAAHPDRFSPGYTDGSDGTNAADPNAQPKRPEAAPKGGPQSQ